MKIDLHVHSKYSKRPSQWILQKIDCPESFTEPIRLYGTALKKGMSFVTITDHNTIEGALEIAHLPNTFISEEVTTYFPEDGCKIHVLVFNINELQHQDIQKTRENVVDLVHYLHGEHVVHVLAHPFYSVNDRMTADHFEKCLLLFKAFEINGARDQRQNRILEQIVTHLQPGDIERLAEKHRIEPLCIEPWTKNITGGSDDHSSLTVARCYTEVEDAQTLEDFFQGIGAGQSRVCGKASTPLTLSHNLYGIAYQFFKSRLHLDRYVSRDMTLRFLDRLLSGHDQEAGVWSRLYYRINQRKHNETLRYDEGVQQLIRYEVHNLIRSDPKLMHIVRWGNGSNDPVDREWFEFVNRISNNVLRHFGNHIMDQFSGAHLFNLFTTLGSAGALYSLLSPYFVAFSLFTKNRQLIEDSKARFGSPGTSKEQELPRANVAHFTDTFYEVNGVALTLQQQLDLAKETGKRLTVITCDTEKPNSIQGVANFKPIAVYEIPEYPELKLFCPPFLEMLNYCYEQQFTRIHSATPGPIGLAALAISRILRLPVSGTYHTSLPEYALYLTDDTAMEEFMWKYILWYYEQMEFIYVPSRSTAQDLTDKGISPDKIRLFPRGVDIEKYHPANHDHQFMLRYSPASNFKLLYVGRVSKEKNLPLLVEVFKALTESTGNITLIVAGDGPYLEAMREELTGMPCCFTGYLVGNALQKLYASCDLFVFPSATDTFGNVVLEAQASGLPVVVTDAGGPQENMLHGETGLVVAANDGHSLLEAIRALLNDRQRLKAMGKAARSYMEDRSFEHAFEQTWEMYHDPLTDSRFSRTDSAQVV